MLSTPQLAELLLLPLLLLQVLAQALPPGLVLVRRQGRPLQPRRVHRRQARGPREQRQQPALSRLPGR
jgi:hypothetical protein